MENHFNDQALTFSIIVVEIDYEKKIIVFGASGFLGKHFLIANKTHELVCINRSEYSLPYAKEILLINP